MFPPRTNPFDESSGALIIKALRELGYTFNQIGNQTGLSGAFISDIEKGKRHPALLNEVLLARLLATHITQFNLTKGKDSE